MPKPKVHFLVCGNQRPPGHPRGSCSEKNNVETINAFSRRWQETQTFDTVMVSVVRSCLGPCQLGPVVVVYPDGVWYQQVDAQKAVKIFDSHVNDGKAVEEYIMPEGSF